MLAWVAAQVASGPKHFSAMGLQLAGGVQESNMRHGKGAESHNVVSAL